jgi:uncharacterized protein
VWQDLGVALCLVLVIEGILPFLYPKRWKEMVALVAEIDERTMRLMGLGSMVLGVVLLQIVRG